MMPVVWITAHGDKAVHGEMAEEEDALGSHRIVYE